jgi:fluoroquinolone resistance protein
MNEIKSYAEYTGEEFDQVSLSKASIERSEFQGCEFTRCDLSQAVLSECRFDDCTFKSCDLSLIKPQDTYFRNCHFVGCKLIGINWTEAAKSFSADFKDCMMHLSSFSGMNLKKGKIINCIATEVSFAESNMTECDCRMTDFSGSIFLRTNLTKANFSDAQHYLIDVRTNTVTKAKFSIPEAISLLETIGIVIVE